MYTFGCRVYTFSGANDYICGCVYFASPSMAPACVYFCRVHTCVCCQGFLLSSLKFIEEQCADQAVVAESVERRASERTAKRRPAKAGGAGASRGRASQAM